MESHKVHTLENGGSNPSPAICQEKHGIPVLIAWAGGAIPQVGSSSGYSSGKSHGKRLLLTLMAAARSKKHNYVASPSGKAPGPDPGIHWFESNSHSYPASGLTGLIHLPAAAGQ